jgi:hypothetical protein
MKKIFYILIAGLLVITACKKESTGVSKPIVSTQKFIDSLLKPTAAFTIEGYAGKSTSIDATPYYYLPATVRLSSASTLSASYEWYLRRAGIADSLLSTAQNPVFNYYSPLSAASIVLIAKNVMGADTITHPFVIKTTPISLTITKIIIDTMSFDNPATSLPWNAVGGANVFCQIFKGSTVIMDTINGPGWSGNPSATTNYPVKTNLTSAAIPYTCVRPGSVVKFKISSAIPGVTMLDNFKVKIFNRNATGTADLIGETDLIPSNYFGGVLPPIIYLSNPAENIYLKLSASWL